MMSVCIGRSMTVNLNPRIQFVFQLNHVILGILYLAYKNFPCAFRVFDEYLKVVLQRHNLVGEFQEAISRI